MEAHEPVGRAVYKLHCAPLLVKGYLSSCNITYVASSLVKSECKVCG